MTVVYQEGYLIVKVDESINKAEIEFNPGYQGPSGHLATSSYIIAYIPQSSGEGYVVSNGYAENGGAFTKYFSFTESGTLSIEVNFTPYMSSAQNFSYRVPLQYTPPAEPSNPSLNTKIVVEGQLRTVTNIYVVLNTDGTKRLCPIVDIKHII